MLENYSTQKSYSWLTWFYRGILVLGGLILIGRLAELQVIKGAYYRDLADGNRARIISIQAPRGKILAKGGEELATNIAIEKTEDGIIKEWQRQYPLKEMSGHLTGFLAEVNEDEVGKVDKNCREKGVRILGSQIGRSGLESQYECKLRGIDGEEIVEVDTMGNRVRVLGRRNPVVGRDIQTNIDFKLQKKVAESMEGLIGAVVITDTQGRVQALFSSPSYDPNLFVDSNADNEKLSDLFVDKNLPLFNRAIGGAYHPGSIFKIVTSTASFEEGAIETDFTYEDIGIVKVDEYEYTNWYFTQYGGKEGVIDTIKALARSTDTFYYKVGEKIGAIALTDWAGKFGLKDRTGIDLPGEIVGLVPTPEWKKAVKGERWFLGNTYHLSIGQGDLTTTPIGLHRVTSVVASGGKLCLPKLLTADPECMDLNISRESLKVIKQGMTEACAPGGTGTPFFNFSPQVACKTGTAETTEEDVTHAWFSVFAPVNNPEIVITVLVEKGGEGSKVAAPVAKNILDFIFNP